MISGARGFTGRYLFQELESAGHEVAGLCSDLLDAEKLSQEIAEFQPQAFVHLAAIAFVDHSDIQRLYVTNVVGTRNVLAALVATNAPVRSVVVASSANVYGNSSAGAISEDEPPMPVNDYAVSKLATEYLAKTWLEQLPIIIVRPFNYTGVGQHSSFLVPKIVEHFAKDAPVIELGNLDVARDFGDVRDVALAYRLILERGLVGQTYNIATGVPTTLTEVLEICSAISGHKIEVKVNANFVRKNEIKLLVGNSSKLAEATGFCRRYDLRQTLQWMLNEV